MHQTAIDRRSLMMHRIIAERRLANPALLEIARGNIARWNCPERNWWREWSGLLERPLEDILAVLERDDEEGCRLRQSPPFAGMLRPQEVWKLKREFKDICGPNGARQQSLGQATPGAQLQEQPARIPSPERAGQPFPRLEIAPPFQGSGISHRYTWGVAPGFVARPFQGRSGYRRRSIPAQPAGRFPAAFISPAQPAGLLPAVPIFTHVHSH